jgi:putative oxidoreductase
MFRRLLFGNSPAFFLDLTHFVLRMSAGLMMVFLHGINKIPPSDRFVENVGALGFPLPGFFAWCAGLAEFAGGLLIAVGLLTRPASFFLAFTMFVAAFGRHLHDPFLKKELSLLYLAIALFFLVHGGGKWSLDRLIGRKK